MLDNMRRGDEWDAENFVDNSKTDHSSKADDSSNTDDIPTTRTDNPQPSTPPRRPLTEEEKEGIARKRAEALAKQEELKRQRQQQQAAPGSDDEIELEIDEGDNDESTKANGTSNVPKTAPNYFDDIPDDVFFNM